MRIQKRAPVRKTPKNRRKYTLILLCGFLFSIWFSPTQQIYKKLLGQNSDPIPENRQINDSTASTTNEVISNTLTNTTQEIRATSTPKIQINDIATLQSEIEGILGEEAENYGVYINFLSSEAQVKINSNKDLPPASTYKVPLAILALRDLEKGLFSEEQTFPLKQKNKLYESDAMYYIETNSEHTIKKYITYLIQQSDNTAMISLEDILANGEISNINNRMTKELGADSFFREPHEATAQNVGIVLEGLYSGRYLKRDNNEFLLNLMKNIPDWMNDRIPAGVADHPAASVAHKVGNLFTNETGITYADSGIVYTPKGDFVIVILNQKTTEEGAKEKIARITLLCYEYLNP